MKTQVDLSRLERDVVASVRKMDRRLVDLRDSAHAAWQNEGERQRDGRRGSGTADFQATNGAPELPPFGQAMARAERDVNKMRDRLLTAQRTLMRCLADWKSDLTALTRERAQSRGVADHLHAAREGAQKNIRRLRNLLDMVSAALARAQSAMVGAPSTIDMSHQRPGHKGEPVDRARVGIGAVTLETVPLLDVVRYGKANCQLILDYPIPRLSQLVAEGDGSLGRKILVGLGLCPGVEMQDLRIELPGLFWRLFRSGRDMRSGTHQGIGE